MREKQEIIKHPHTDANVGVWVCLYVLYIHIIYIYMNVYIYIHIYTYTSIAHRIENPLRRTSERFVKNVSWSSKINASFSHSYIAAYDFIDT